MLKKILKEGASLFSLNSFKIISIFGTTYLIANYSDIKTFGKFSYLLSILMTLSNPVRQGIVLYLTNEINSSRENVGIILGDVLAVLIMVFPFVNLFFFIFVYNDVPLDIIIKLSILIPILILKALFTGYLIGIDKTLFAKIPELIIFPTAFIIVLYNFKNTLDLGIVINGFFVAHIIQFITSLGIFIHFYNFKSKLILKLKKKSFTKIFPYSLSNSFQTLNTNIIQLISGYFGLFELIGQYKIIQDIFKIPLFVKSSIITVFSPKISKLIVKNKVLFQNLISKLNSLTLLFLIIFVIPLILFNDTVFNFFSLNNNEIKTALYFFVFSEIIITISSYGAITLLMTSNPYTLGYIRIISMLILTFILYFSLGFGIIGVGFAILFYSFSMSLSLIYYNQKLNKIKVFLLHNPLFYFKKI